MEVVAKVNGLVLVGGDGYGRAARVHPKGYIEHDAEVAVVPHTMDTTTKLMELGCKYVTSPMQQEYKYTYVRDGKHYPPMDHQIVTADFAVRFGNCFVLNDPGTSKTVSCLWAWHYLRSKGLAKRLTVFCPPSVIVDAWYADIMRTMPQVRVGICRGDKDYRVKIIRSDCDIIITNHDTIVHTPEMFGDKRTTHVIVDEAYAVARHSSQRSKLMRKFCADKITWVVTATPVSQSPTRAWALCQLVDPSRVPKYYGQWADKVEVKQSHFRTKVRPEAKDLVFEAMQPAVRFKKSECLTLPGTLPPQYRQVPLSKEQDAFAKNMLKDWVHEDAASGMSVSAINAGVRSIKLAQAYAGTVKRDDGSYLELDYKSRFEELINIIEETEGKTIVFTSFTGPNLRLIRDLNAHYKDEVALSVTGQVTGAPRDKVLSDFKNENHKSRVLVAQPQTASHGLTLVCANAIVWFNPHSKVEHYIQGNERTDRPGQTRQTTVYHLYSTPAEKRMYEGLASGVDIQNTILDAYVLATRGLTKG